MSKWKNVRTYLEVNPYTGQPVEEDAPTNSAGSGAVAGIGVGPDGEPGFDPKKKKKKTLIDARSKSYKEHRMRLEKARQRREERKSRLAKKVAENIDNFAREKYIEENNSEKIKKLEKMLQDLERKKKKTPGGGFAKMIIKKMIADLKGMKEEIELDERAKIEFNDDDKNTISITKKGKLQGKMTKRSDGTWGVVRGGKHYPIKGGKNLDVAKAAVRDLFGEDVELDEVRISDYVVDTLRDIKRSKSSRNLKLKGGDIKIDMDTANKMLDFLDKMSSMGKKKIMGILDKGTKTDFMKVNQAMMKAVR